MNRAWRYLVIGVSTMRSSLVSLINVVLISLMLTGGGCIDPKEQFGKTYYMDGAGNWGFGVVDVPAGLASAGYQGHVEIFIWTSTFLPAIDQVNISVNKLRAAMLSDKIKDYLRRQAEQSVNLVALSAGTGIAVWAVESLPNGVMIDNLVLLGSSLSYNYDMSKALGHIKGKVYVFYSPHDEVLSTGVRILGTVDGTHEDSAGLVGLQPPGGDQGRIVNVAWSEQYLQYGWTGAHTDATNRKFIKEIVAPRILGAQLHQREEVGAEGITQASASVAAHSRPGLQ